MSDLNSTLGLVLGRQFLAHLTRINELSAPLTDDQFWRKPFPYGNSFGHLVLHLTGNLNYYIGSQIANTGYVRDRPREFNDPNPPAREQALDRLHDAVTMVIKTLGNQKPDDWGKEYWGAGTNCTDRLAMFAQCAAHMQHHIGQMIYLRYEWQRQAAGQSPEQP